MARKQPAPPTLTAPRLARLYKLLTLLSESATLRTALLKRLKVNLRVFYRDLSILRSLGIPITSAEESYSLPVSLSDAFQRLPFPDPGLSFDDMLTLSEGRSDAHRKLRTRISSITGRERVRRPARA